MFAGVRRGAGDCPPRFDAAARVWPAWSALRDRGRAREMQPI